MTETRKDPISEEVLFELASKYINIDDMKLFKGIISWFPPSMHKSLIQKLIRTRCNKVEYNNIYYDPGVVLLVSMVLLLLNPGVFVPNIRRFVTGLESVTKRLAVSICEDSYTEKNDILMGLYASAMVSQDDRNWIPTNKMIESWFVLALETQRDKRMYDFDWKSFDGSVSQYDHLFLSYIILNEIRSFKSDISMVGSIAQNNGKTRITMDNRIDVMPLIHCLDHHSFTEIAHYLPYTGKPYKEIFGAIWYQVVGVNPRYIKYKDYYDTMEQQPFVKQVRIAQCNAWISKMHIPIPRQITKNISKFIYKLDPSWLAGLVGPIEIRLFRSTAIVVLRVDNIYEMTAVKRPQRDTKANPELTESEQIKSIKLAKIILSKGIKLESVPSTLPLFRKAVITLVNDQYIITIKNGEKYLWETIINMVYNLPVHNSITTSIYNALIYTGDGIDAKSDNTINYIVTNYSNNVLRRLSSYLTGYKSTIELAKISRDGSGTYYQVVPEDTAVNHILCYLCVMYPAAIMKSKFGFKVKTGPLLWVIRDLINQYISRTISFEQKWALPLEEKRKRWDHQISSFNQLVKRNK